MTSEVLARRLDVAIEFGDTNLVQELINRGADVNLPFGRYGTPLHKACKKGFPDIVALLLKHGANKNLKTFWGETAASVYNNQRVLELLQSDIQLIAFGAMTHQIIPKHIKSESLTTEVGLVQQSGMNDIRYEAKNNNGLQDELVIKMRIANAPDPDFVEVELPRNNLTYQALVQICCDEFGLSSHQIFKLRKLPNTKLRKDNDVRRLKNFQEIEIVTDPANVYKHVQYSNGITNNVSSVPANGYQSISKKDQTILY